ncbi:BREX-2 system adenine-specific DNA-methyltransferase PglX [Thermobifida halotolerans]|uniref:site-specific DNA-methyltransferase (adenine-specific) n=1 Tax=Thermobifida halotolerans TaxID=483545 RepID=A0A399G648_9ACTN|nr:BREX-2 system adenine-specific DNA-methyltransferase PglX [Thermobifida halotolerans]UOE18242.1 BREX-2 system adenine-specific DNA-methyltransferase PglX [Thermobifida halotolerans]
MVNHASLLEDLKKQVRVLEDDLRERSEDPEAVNEHTGEPFRDELKREYHRAFEAERTAATYGAWRDERVTQAAVAWVLATVFVRFCEDNRLLEHPFIAGPRDETGRYDIAQELKEAWVAEDRSRTDRDWLVHSFEAMSVSPVMAGLFDRAHNPMWTITPSHQAAKNLIGFWREVGDDGHLVHDFADPEWNTRFLGDLYQDLSENIRKNYALLQTPEFVEEFILDYTLEPAVEEFGLDGSKIYQAESTGFRLIDPTCGSGHFLLGAFHRLLNKWREAEPGASDWDLIARTLRSVHGVDKNPYAVAIARFRLFIAAVKEAGITTLSEGNPDWPIVVATGDSLIHGRGAPGRKQMLFDDGEDVYRYSVEDVYDYVDTYDLLGVHSYHAVVGNPPYITVRDKQENQNYRDRYATCAGTYALSVPFAERFFNLAKRAGGDRTSAGFVGQITANSFMKREFGKKLISEFFNSEVQLTHIIDTSGAYIPGHGTPTVILIGRNTKNLHKETVRAVLGIRGEPSQPQNPAEGLVWSAIVNQIENPGSESDWVSSVDFPWEVFKSHPWSLSGGGAGFLVQAIQKRTVPMADRIEKPTGRAIRAGADEAYIRPLRPTYYTIADRAALKPLVIGEIVRDWGESPEEAIWYPYSKGLETSEFERELWRFRTFLAERRTFQGNMSDAGLEWWEYMQHTASAYHTPFSVAFAFVATHNHFVLDRGGKVFKQSAPVIKLPKDATEDQHLELLGVLNSSTACFWLKQVCHDKGSQSGTGGFMHDEWERFYEFTGTKLQEFPLPPTLPLDRARELDSLAQRLSSLEPSSVMESATPTRAALNEARAEYAAVRSRMIALQEELDWDVYHRYGLITDAEHAGLVLPDTAEVPGINLGERAFEIVLARRVKAGETGTVWFSRHGSTPITEIPVHWPDAYKRVVEKRIEFIENRRDLALIERPECKRRWQSEPWEKKEKAALKSWLLDRCEAREIWFAPDDTGQEVPRTRSVLELANRLRDVCPDAVTVAALYAPDADFAQVVAEIVATEHVPYLAALRYKDSGLRKRQQWEEVWDKQRQEDALNADRAEGEPEHRLPIPVPPKYTSADFRKPSYWANRGKLDVPKERFVSYPGAEAGQDSSPVLGWAGWNHAEQADALTRLAFDRIEEHGWAEDRDRMTPLLAGLAELRPWVRQWHSDPDAYGQSPADYLEEDLADLKDRTGVTDSDMAAWRPPARQRGRGRK